MENVLEERYLANALQEKEQLILLINRHIARLQGIDSINKDKELGNVLQELSEIKTKALQLSYGLKTLGYITEADNLMLLYNKIGQIKDLLPKEGLVYVSDKNELKIIIKNAIIEYRTIDTKINKIVEILRKYPASSLFDSLVVKALELAKQKHNIVTKALESYIESTSIPLKDVIRSADINKDAPSKLLANYQDVLASLEDSELQELLFQLEEALANDITNEFEFKKKYGLIKIDNPYKKFQVKDYESYIDELETAIDKSSVVSQILGIITYVGVIFATSNFMLDKSSNNTKLFVSLAIGFLIEALRATKEHNNYIDRLDDASNAYETFKRKRKLEDRK